MKENKLIRFLQTSKTFKLNLGNFQMLTVNQKHDTTVRREVHLNSVRSFFYPWRVPFLYSWSTGKEPCVHVDWKSYFICNYL